MASGIGFIGSLGSYEPYMPYAGNNPKLVEIWVTPFALSIGVERRLQIALGHIVRQRPAKTSILRVLTSNHVGFT